MREKCTELRLREKWSEFRKHALSTGCDKRFKLTMDLS